MSLLPTERHPSTATSGLPASILEARPASRAALDVNVTDVERRAPPRAPNMGLYMTGSVVGIDAFGSPMSAYAIMPPFTTILGLAPKNCGDHTAMSARRPGSSDPTCRETPCATAGLIVIFAR